MACGVPVVATAVGGHDRHRRRRRDRRPRAAARPRPRSPPRCARCSTIPSAGAGARPRRAWRGRASATRWDRVAAGDARRLRPWSRRRARRTRSGGGRAAVDRRRQHVRALEAALDAPPRPDARRRGAGARAWPTRLRGGGRLLAAGNGGSAAQAQHLTAELVGRYRDERRPLSAIALHAETSSLTAIGNDYGPDAVFARQVRAHGRPGDVLVVLSPPAAARTCWRRSTPRGPAAWRRWALTGPAPNPLAAAARRRAGGRGPVTRRRCRRCTWWRSTCCARRWTRRSRRAPARLSAVRVSRRIVVVGDVAAGPRPRRPRRAALPGRARAGPRAHRDPGARRRRRPGGDAAGRRRARRDARHGARRRTRRGMTLAALLASAASRSSTSALGGATAEKVRIRADGQVLARLDRGERAPAIRPPGARGAPRRWPRPTPCWCRDYGRGVTADAAVRASLAGAGPLVWDPHPRGAPPVPGAALLTPNLAEAVRMTGAGRGPRGRRRAAWCAGHGAWAVAVTVGAVGVVLVVDGAAPAHVPARPPRGDPCGAGDRFASRRGALAAVRAVRGGAAAVGGRRVRRGRRSARRRRLRRGGAPRRRRRSPPAPAVGGTSSPPAAASTCCTPGHVATLHAARALGDWLVVLPQLRRVGAPAEGAGPPAGAPGRPGRRAARRCAASTRWWCSTRTRRRPPLRACAPDVWVKGGDYAADDLPEAAVVRALGRRGGHRSLRRGPLDDPPDPGGGCAVPDDELRTVLVTGGSSGARRGGRRPPSTPPAGTPVVLDLRDRRTVGDAARSTSPTRPRRRPRWRPWSRRARAARRRRHRRGDRRLRRPAGRDARGVGPRGRRSTCSAPPPSCAPRCPRSSDARRPRRDGRLDARARGRCPPRPPTARASSASSASPARSPPRRRARVGVTMLVPGGMQTAFFDGRRRAVQARPGRPAQPTRGRRGRGGVRAAPARRAARCASWW